MALLRKAAAVGTPGSRVMHPGIARPRAVTRHHLAYKPEVLVPMCALPAPDSMAAPLEQSARAWEAGVVQSAARGNLLERLAQAAVRVMAIAGIALALVLGSSERALAAQSGGRVGGSSGFSRAATRTPSSSSTSSFAARSSRVSRTTVTHHHTTVISTCPSFGFGWGWGMPMFGSPVMGLYSGFSVMSSIMTATLFAMAAFFVIKALRSRGGEGSNTAVAEYDDDDDYEAVAPVTVAKLQVGVLGVARTLKAQLDALGTSANTHTPEGLHAVLQETVLGLLRNPHYAVYGHSSCATLDTPDAAERAFGSMTLEERARVKQETLVNTSGTGLRTSQLAADSKDVSELMVVTVMVAAEGEFSLSPVRSAADLKTALKQLGAVTPSNIMALEVTWTPQADNDSLTSKEVMLEYPELVPL